MDLLVEVEHEDIQKKTFTKWINAKLTSQGQPGITDLFEDLRDGTRLLVLLEMLTGTPMKPEIGRMRVHHLNNVNQAFQLLNHYKVKLVNISSDHIVDGNAKMTLGLIWSIIQHWQMTDVFKSSATEGEAESNMEKTLLEWCRYCTQGYQNVDVTNFTSSWCDGLAFNALIHHFYPELFDFDRLIGADNLSNLQHAFSIGQQKLGIVRLLDPEDVSVSNPDKKSIMMYVVCCYQVLSHGRINFSQAPSALPDADDSTAVNATSFQNDLETVLTWLLEAQETLSRQKPIADDVHTVKEQFQEHEEFMVGLTIQQNRIGQILQVGSQILGDSKTTDDEARQVEAQMSLLNSHWEDLRVRAMDRQTSLQQALTSLQQQQLDKLSQWLATMESRLAECSKQDFCSDRLLLQQQLDEHKLLQEAVEKEQEYVSSLQNMVVVVDENNSDDAYVALERQLESLGLRWGNVCRGVEERAVTLQNALVQWKNFDSLLDEFSNWLSQSEDKVSQMPSVDCSTDMATIVEQVRLLKSLEGEIDAWIPRYEDLQARGKKLVQNASRETVLQVDDQLQRLRTRWDAIVQRMEQRSCEIMQSGVELNVTKNDQDSSVLTVTRKVETQIISRTVTLPVTSSPTSKRPRMNADTEQIAPVLDSSGLLAEVKALYAIVDEFNAVDVGSTDGNVAEAKKKLELCKVKLSELLSHRNTLNMLNDRVHEELKQRTAEGTPLESELSKLNRCWTEVVQKLGDHQLRLTQSVESTASDSFSDALAAFIVWMEGVEQLLSAEKFVVDDQEVMEQQLTQYQLLQKEVDDHKKDFEWLNSASRQVLQKSPAAEADKLRSDMQKTQWRWASLIDAVAKRLSQCRSAIEQVKQFKDQTVLIKQWIADMEEFIRPFTEPFTSLETLRDQLSESQAVDQDIKTMEASLAGISSSSQALMESASSGPFHEKIRLQTQELNSLFADIVKRVRSHNDVLSSTLLQAQQIMDKIRELDAWIDEFTANNLRRDILATTKEELTQLEVDFKNLTEQVSANQLRVRQINDELKSLANGPIVLTQCEDLNKALEQLNAKWTQLQSQTKEAYDKVQHFAENYTILSGLLRDELRWLDQLERKLSAGPRPSGDAEELSEELDELENFVHSQKDGNRTKLNELAKTLIDGKIMTATVEVELASYQERHAALTDRAKQMMVHLEECIIQAQNRESRILDMSQWMAEMNELLQSRLDADILAGDVPKEYETLKTEFAQQEHLLRELEADATVFREEKKFEAAERLEQQIALLKRHFVEVSAKFAKFQRPADFDTKMTHVKRVLDDIDQRYHLIDLTSSDLESVQNKLDQCTKFYRTMSEIKSDVEYVIKTGRQIVDKKQVDFPGTLTSQIDAVKQQYNRLGSQVTASKSTLEKAAKLSSGLTAELAEIQSYVDLLRGELVRKESLKTVKHLTEELEWSELKLAEIDQKQQLIVGLDDVLMQFSKLSDDVSVTDLEQEIQHVNEQLSETADKLGSWQARLQELLNHSEQLYAQFQGKLNEVIEWMNVTEVTLGHISNNSLENDNSVTASRRQQLQSKRSQLVNKVDEIRDIAVELISSSKKHERLVEPQLTAFNQRWLNLDEALKSAINHNTQIDSTTMECKAVRATAALTQLLAEDADGIDSSSADTLVSQFPNVSDSAADDDVARKLLAMKEDERNLRIAVESVRRNESAAVTCSSQEIINLQTELEACQSRLYELQHNSEMLTTQTGSSTEVSTTVINLEKKIAEIKLYLASLNAAKSVTPVDAAAASQTREIADADRSTVQIVRPVESTSSVQYDKSSSSSTVVTTVTTTKTVHQSSSVHVAPVTGEVVTEMVSMPKLDNFIAKLDKFAVVLSEKAKSYPVIIGNIEEIELATQTKQTVENDLRMMKPQIDAIVTKCEALKNESTSEQYNRLLNDNVNRLYQCWQSAIATVAQRHQVLEQMLVSCRQFAVKYAETEEWIEETINRYGRDDIGTDVVTIKQQIDILESERLELTDSRKRVDMVVAMAQKLIDDHSADDPIKVIADITQINERWQVLLTRLSEREKSLQNAINSMYRFESDLKNCQLWLTKVEVVLNHHSQKLVDVSRMDETQINQMKDAVRDLHSEMESQRTVLESLNSMARKMTSDDVDRSSSVSGGNLQSQLDDMNRRLAKLSSRALEIRSQLEMTSHSDVSDESVKKLSELVRWLEVKDDSLNRQRPVAGDIESVRQQLDIVQSLQKELDAYQPKVDECLRKVRTFVHDNKESLASDSVNKVDRLIEILNQKWNDVLQNARHLQSDIEETLEKLVLLQDALEDLTQRLQALEKETVKWKRVEDVVVEDLQQQIDSTLMFQQKVAPTQSEVDHCNDLANQFTDVVLSHKNVSRLEDLNKRWQALHTEVEKRLKALQDAHREFGPHSQQLLTVSVTEPWERAVANNHVPYYINHKNESTHWDHPEMADITQDLVEFNNVRFSAYRTAMKLHKLQKRLNLDLIELENANKVFDSLPKSRNGDVAMVSVSDIINCLLTLYEPLAIHAPSARNVNILLSVDLVLNWLLNVYDSGRSGQMRALSFKVAIILMCNAHYEDKYRSMFRVAANANNKLDRQGMTTLLRDCIQIPKQLGEVAAFGGSNVEPSVLSCFEKSGSQPEITAAQFVDWMKLEPQSMVWIPVMHRVSAAENSRHQARCSVCKKPQIVGLRYRCLKCFTFDMCQTCFFSGQTAKSHKLTHPMQEYCGTTTSSEDMRDFTKVFKNKFRSKQYFKKHPRLGYLPVNTVMEGGPLERSVSEDSSLRDVVSTSNATSVTSTPKEHRNVVASVQQRVPTSPTTQQSTSTLEMHSRLGVQAQRLATVEKKQLQRSASNDVEDEHSLIVQYCQNLHGHKTDTLKSPMQIMAGLDAEQQAEMEAMIRELESENRALQAEYDQLLLTHRDPSVHPDPSRQHYNNGVGSPGVVPSGDSLDARDAELLAEAKQLAKHKTQLEVRMRILEDHNRQLEAQLQRLHLLLDQPEADGAHVVTFSASERQVPSMSAASSHSSLPRRDPPTFAAYQQSLRDKSTPVQNGTYSASEQRLLSEEEELERMMKELQETFPATEGGNNVGNLFQTVGQVSKAVGTLVNIMTVDNEEPVQSQ